MVQSPISGAAHELKTSEINEENKQEAHISSSKMNSSINLVQRKGKENPKKKKMKHAHRRLDLTMTNKWLFLSTPKQIDA